MERKVTKLEHCHTEVLVNVDKDLWKKQQQKAFNKIAASITVPGFRKGKAPANLLKGHVDQMKVFNEAINNVLQPVYEDILKNEDIQPVARPAFAMASVIFSGSNFTIFPSRFTILLNIKYTSFIVFLSNYFLCIDLSSGRL